MTKEDIEHVYYILSGTLILSDEDVRMIIDAIVDQEMRGTPEQISAASRIKAECVGLAFLFLGRWNKTGRIRKRLGMGLEEAKLKVLAIAGAINSAAWWIRNRQTIQLTEILEGKKLVQDFLSETIDSELRKFFRK